MTEKWGMEMLHSDIITFYTRGGREYFVRDDYLRKIGKDPKRDWNIWKQHAITLLLEE